MSKHNSTTETESELKVIPLRELQVKLLASLRGDSPEFVVQVLTNAFHLGNYQISHTARTPIIDEYIDTDDLLLFRSRKILRVRRKGDGLVVTKKDLKSFSVGEFHREEKNWSITEAQYKEELSKGFETYKNSFQDVGTRPMNIKLKVVNERDTYRMKGAADEYELAVDVFTYANPLTGQYAGQQFEVEVEAKNEEALARLPKIKESLLLLLSSGGREFRFAEDTKYERGVKILGLEQPTWIQRLSAWSTNSNAGLINIGIGIIGVLLAVISLVVAALD